MRYKPGYYVMKKVSFRFLLPGLMLFLLGSCLYDNTASMPKAKNGVLDAEGLFSKKPVSLYLDGEWEFFPNELLSPGELASRQATQTQLSPGLWRTKGDKPQIRTATYRLKVVNHDLPPVFSVRNHQIFSAFRLFLNGEEILNNGEVSYTRQGEEPCYHPRTVSVYTQADTLEFILHVSNHHYRKGGIAESIIIGKVSCLLRNNLAGTGFDFFLTGSLLIMAIYYVSLSFIFRKERSSLFFSIFIFISIIRILVTGQRLLLFMFPSMTWDTMLRLEYGTFYIAPVFFILFFNAIFKEEVKIYAVNLVLAISGFFTLMVLFTPVSLFTRTLPYYQFYILILGLFLLYWLWKARRNNKEGALVLLLGIIVLFATLLHDMMFAYGSLRGSEIFPAGLFIFILCQSYVISLKFSSINKENQQLWGELDYKNQNLELLVRDRTQELVEQRNLLQKTNDELEKKKETLSNQGRNLEVINEMLDREREKSDRLLLNVLPQHIAEELKLYGKSMAHSYPQVSVLFVDFVRFSDISESIDASELLKQLHFYFAGFDDIAKKFNLEKIKTIGDAYMCAGGLHEDADESHVRNTVLAALEMSLFIRNIREEREMLGDLWLDCRIGIHTGPVIAGVVGKTKFAFDIWGPTVNIAKRMEAACEPGKVNVSEFTYNFIRDEFVCKSRGLISMKHKKNMQMFYVAGLKE